MLGDYKVNRCTRQCHAQQRPLREGEWYYSVILEIGDDYQRREYSAEAWDGPPKEAIGWWKKQMPKRGQRKMVLAPPGVLVDLLRQMEHFPERSKSRYLLALMLMRKRLIQPVDSVATSEPESNPALVVQVIGDGSTISVPVCSIGRSESEQLVQELNELLYCEESSPLVSSDESDGGQRSVDDSKSDPSAETDLISSSGNQG